MANDLIIKAFLIVSISLLAFSTVSLVAAASYDDTKFLEPLRHHYQQFKALDAAVDEMLKGEDRQQGGVCRRDDAVDAEIIGRHIYIQGKAYVDLVHKFRTNETRRGLKVERRLLLKTGEILEKLPEKFGQLKGVNRPEIPADEQNEIRRQVRKAVLGILKKQISKRLESDGLKELLNSQSWEEVRDKAIARVDSEIKGKIEHETERLFGLKFHNSRSLKRAIQRRAEREVERQVGKLLVKITSSEFLIQLGTRIIVKWLKNEIWPKIREALRPKGNLEKRTEISIATLEKARIRLDSYGGDAKIRDVQSSMEVAKATQHATRYLGKDLKRAGKEELINKLDAAKKNLDRGMKKTEHRFMLDIENYEDALVLAELTLKELLKEFKQMIGDIDEGKPGPDHAFFIVKVAGSGYIPHEGGASHEVKGDDQKIFKIKWGQDVEDSLSASLVSMLTDVCKIEGSTAKREPSKTEESKECEGPKALCDKLEKLKKHRRSIRSAPPRSSGTSVEQSSTSTSKSVAPEKGRPAVWNEGPQLTVVCGPFFDQEDIDKNLLSDTWKHLRDDAPSLSDLKEQAGCG